MECGKLHSDLFQLQQFLCSIFTKKDATPFSGHTFVRFGIVSH